VLSWPSALVVLTTISPASSAASEDAISAGETPLAMNPSAPAFITASTVSSSSDIETISSDVAG